MHAIFLLSSPLLFYSSRDVSLYVCNRMNQNELKTQMSLQTQNSMKICDIKQKEMQSALEVSESFLIFSSAYCVLWLWKITHNCLEWLLCFVTKSSELRVNSVNWRRWKWGAVKNILTVLCRLTTRIHALLTCYDMLRHAKCRLLNCWVVWVEAEEDLYILYIIFNKSTMQ